MQQITIEFQPCPDHTPTERVIAEVDAYDLGNAENPLVQMLECRQCWLTDGQGMTRLIRELRVPAERLAEIRIHLFCDLRTNLGANS